METLRLTERLGFGADVIAIAIVVLAALGLLLLNRARIMAGLREWKIQRCLGRIGSEQIRDLVCADGLDGFYKIDRLALTPDAILLISYKPFGGNIYCAERISEWTQVVGQKSFKFENPLFELENQITALRLLIGNVPLRGYLFFNHSASFPKGHPDSVLDPASLPDRFLEQSEKPPNAQVLAAWSQLRALGAESAAGGSLGVKT